MMKKWLTIAALALVGWAAPMSAQATDVELTGWPYQVDVVRENLERFSSQSGLSATFNPFPSNEYHTKMVSSFASGTNFDVVYVRDSFLAEWPAAGWIVPLDKARSMGLNIVNRFLSDEEIMIFESLFKSAILTEENHLFMRWS